MTASGWVPSIEDLERGMAERIGSRAGALLDEAATEFSDVVDHTMMEDGRIVQDDAPWHFWWDLRPSEVERLREIMDEARAQAVSEARQAIMRELLEGARAFAREFPDAPRPVPAPAP